MNNKIKLLKVALMALLLAGCGLKGPLYMPAPAKTGPQNKSATQDQQPAVPEDQKVGTSDQQEITR